MLIELNNTEAQVAKATDEELGWLSGYLTFEDESSKYTRDFITGKVKVNSAKQISLLTYDKRFPAGLLRMVRAEALRNGMMVSIMDSREAPCEVLPPEVAYANTELAPGGSQELYDYQAEAVDAAVARTKGIIDSPTGSGKTNMMVAVALRLGMTNTLIVAPEADLMHNAADRYTKLTGMQAGRIGDGRFDIQDGLTCATFQTLARRLQDGDKKLAAYLETVGAVLIDEVHQSAADGYYRVAQTIPAYWRLGFSGTPLARGDRRSLFSVATTGSIIYKVDVQMLIDRGFVSRPHIQMVECTQNSECTTWRKSYTTNIVKSKKRNAIIANIAAVAPKPGLVFVREKKHGLALEKLLKDKGIACEFVWGQKKTHERDAAIQRLRDGELDIIVCSVIFQTGTDIPEVQSMVIACGGKSEIATLQRIGRGMRILRDSQGKVIKDHFYVYDILDKALKGPGRGNRWNVKHSNERFKTYRSVGHEVTVKEGM